VFPPLSRIDVTRPRASTLAVVPRGVVREVLRPFLSCSTTVPFGRVVRENLPFVLLGRPLLEALFSSVFLVPPDGIAEVFREPRRSGRFVKKPRSSAGSVGWAVRPCVPDGLGWFSDPAVGLLFFAGAGW
jgi:hypothetical protein